MLKTMVNNKLLPGLPYNKRQDQGPREQAIIQSVLEMVLTSQSVNRHRRQLSCLLAIVIVLSLPTLSFAQEVVVSGFPVGVAGSVDDNFFEAYYPRLQMIADTLNNYPLLHAIVIGGADGMKFNANNDAKNPALALGRAHVLRSVLLDRFGVDSSQLVIQTEDARVKGEQFRHATVRIIWQLNDFKARLDRLASREPIIQQPITQVTEIREITRDLAENMGLRLSAGFSSTPFGAVPVVSAAVVWEKRIYIEALFGHSLWNGSFGFLTEDLDTRRRMAAGLVTYFPFENTRIGFLAGWVRVEEIAQRYYEYVKMSEGPMFGATYYPFDFASITAAYNPARQRIVGEPIKETRSNEFMISASFHIQFGGEK